MLYWYYCFSNFSLENKVRKLQAGVEELRLNGAHQLPVCVDYVNLLGGNTHTKKKTQKF